MRAGANPLLQSKNKEIVVALREIAAGLVTLAQAQPLLRETLEGQPIDEGQSE